MLAHLCILNGWAFLRCDYELFFLLFLLKVSKMGLDLFLFLIREIGERVI